MFLKVDVQITAMKRLYLKKTDNVDSDDSMQIVHTTLSD